MISGTKQFWKRNAILDCLRQTKRHPGAEDLFLAVQEKYPGISRATVYRNLALFRSQGLIISVGSVNGIERFDGDTSPHAHFVCRCCGDVADLPGLSVPESLCHAAAQALSSQVESAQLTLTGLCSSCLSNTTN